MTSAIVNSLAFPHPPRSGRRAAPGGPLDELRKVPELLWLTTSAGEKIPALYVQRKKTSASRAARFLVLYSHGNAEDLADLAGHAFTGMVGFMSRRLDADVLAYEYVGYSIADGSPSEEGCYASAEAAYAWAVRPAAEGGGGASPAEVVPFGRSLGSAPACYMASLAPTPVGGLLLQSPLLSGGNALLGRGVATLAFCLDVLKNYKHIHGARCRVAICHGTEDGVVPCWNGRKLLELAAKTHETHEPLWCEGRGHNDMDENVVLEWARGFLDVLARERVLAGMPTPLV